MNNIQFSEIREFVENKKPIANGHFGNIYAGKYSGEDVAIKEINSSDRKMKEVNREIELLRTIRHENVIKLYGNAKEDLKMYLIMEFMDGGSLHKVVHESDVPHTQKAINWLCQAVKGLVALHTHTPSIIHRDIKPANMLLDESREILKICDFGLGRYCSTIMTTRTGTYIYMSPEVLKGTYYNEKYDVYSLGITIWEVLSRKVPYYNQERIESKIVKDVIKKYLRPDLEDLPKDCPIHIKALITKCWDHVPNNRPTMQEILITLSTV